MTNIRKKIIGIVGAATLSLVTAVPAFALTSQPCTSGGSGSGLCNPLNSSFSSIPAFIAGALQVMVQVALPIIALFIVISGFMFVLARGNESKLTKAKENFVYVIIGALLILGAWLIATLIAGTVTQLVGN